MGITKDHLFTAAQNRVAALARVLGHPARIAILQHLARTNTCMNGSLVEELGLAQPTISQHLWELKNAGLIKGTIEGNGICYCIDPAGWKKLRDQLDGLLANVENNCCLKTMQGGRSPAPDQYDPQ
jgi:DNA-binding transcriptional ArsR family regulator